MKSLKLKKQRKLKPEVKTQSETGVSQTENFVSQVKPKSAKETAYKQYQKRLQKGESLEERLKNAEGTAWGKGFTKVSSAREKQLAQLSKEQLAALDDRTLDILAYNHPNSKKMENFDYLKSMTPTEILRLKENPYGEGTLQTLVNGTYNNQEELQSVTRYLDMIIGR